MKETICFTSANLAYLGRAALLAESVRRHNPTWYLVIVLVDEPSSDPIVSQLLGLFDETIYASSLYGRGFRQWIFGMDVVEACTAVKGRALQKLLARSPKMVVYLDPDVYVYSGLDEVLAEPREASILLTPHQLAPDSLPKSIEDNELGSLRTGIFNLGFLAVKPTVEGVEFAKWWAARLERYCFDDPSRGLFTDQRWMDHVPVFFPTSHVLRHAGLNVASWNLSQRHVYAKPDGVYMCNQDRLVFWHFTKSTTLGPMMTLRYGAADVAVVELWRHYLELLQEVTGRLGPRSWAYGQFDDGRGIKPQARSIYRSRTDLRGAFVDPFVVSGKDSYADWFEAHAEASRA